MTEPRSDRTLADWEAASDAVSDAYFPHHLEPLAHRSAAGMTVDSLDIGLVRIAHITWGADVSIETDHPGAYAINVPLSGYLQSTTRTGEQVSTEGIASVFRPDTDSRITRWSASCEIVGVRIDRDFLHREASRILAGQDFTLPERLDLTSGAGASWLELVQSLSHHRAVDGDVWRNSLVADQLSGAVASAFLLAATGHDGQTPARPRIVKRVLDLMCADPSRPWTAADMAAAAEVSIRRLQEGFRQYVGATPSEVLLRIRLERAHEELRRGDPTRRVADIALDCGFTHTGRFAAAYRNKYGESPSTTHRKWV